MNHLQNHMYKWNQIQALVWLIWRQITLWSAKHRHWAHLRNNKKYQELPTIHSTGFYPFKIFPMFKLQVWKAWNVRQQRLVTLTGWNSELSLRQVHWLHFLTQASMAEGFWMGKQLGPNPMAGKPAPAHGQTSEIACLDWTSSCQHSCTSLSQLGKCTLQSSHYFLGRARLTTSYNYNPEENQRKHIRTMSRCNLRCIREAGTAPEIQWDLQVALCRPLARTKTYEPSKLPLSTMLGTLQKVFTRKKGYTVYAILHPNPSKSTDESSYVTSHPIISYLMTHYRPLKRPWMKTSWIHGCCLIILINTSPRSALRSTLARHEPWRLLGELTLNVYKWMINEWNA